jgi:N-acetylglucosaminyl-diphospho-decaprenol L-rhamnosyltransferase
MSRATQQPPAVDVAIVNWNTSEAALEAAHAFAASQGVEARVTLVDNASAPAQRELLAEAELPGVRLVLNAENAGYGTAANRALATGAAETVCVSNADVLPEPGALAMLAAATRNEPRAGVVAPAFDDDAGYHAELPGRVAILGQTLAGSFMRRAVASPPIGETLEIGQPSGACFAMRRETWKRLGGFDEGFHLWYEDVDLAKRSREAGCRNLVVGSARVGHANATSFRQLDGRTLQALRLASLRRYVDKHHPGLKPVAAPLLGLSAALRARPEREGS